MDKDKIKRELLAIGVALYIEFIDHNKAMELLEIELCKHEKLVKKLANDIGTPTLSPTGELEWHSDEDNVEKTYLVNSKLEIKEWIVELACSLDAGNITLDDCMTQVEEFVEANIVESKQCPNFMEYEITEKDNIKASRYFEDLDKTYRFEDIRPKNIEDGHLKNLDFIYKQFYTFKGKDCEEMGNFM